MGKISKTGKAKQLVYDAIKKAREEGEAWVTFKGERLKLIDPEEFPENGYGPSGLGLVNCNGRIHLSEIYSKDRLTWCYIGNNSRYIQPHKHIMAYVAERHSR